MHTSKMLKLGFNRTVPKQVDQVFECQRIIAENGSFPSRQQNLDSLLSQPSEVNDVVGEELLAFLFKRSNEMQRIIDLPSIGWMQHLKIPIERSIGEFAAIFAGLIDSGALLIHQF